MEWRWVRQLRLSAARLTPPAGPAGQTGCCTRHRSPVARSGSKAHDGSVSLLNKLLDCNTRPCCRWAPSCSEQLCKDRCVEVHKHPPYLGPVAEAAEAGGCEVLVQVGLIIGALPRLKVSTTSCLVALP